MKLKNILKQYNITASVLDAKLNNHASIWTDERLGMSEQINVQNGDLYMRHRYPEKGKYGNWKCVAKVELIKDELSKLPELKRS